VNGDEFNNNQPTQGKRKKRQNCLSEIVSVPDSA